jgi:hypothetical protein
MTWREGEKITKAEVVRAGLSGRRMRSKTSRHMIQLDGRLDHISAIEWIIDIPLEKLK